MNLLADVIFPAFQAPYVASLLLPVAGISAIVVEIVVFWLLNRHVGVGKIVVLVVAANLVSGLVGFFLAAVLPSGLVPRVVGSVNGRPFRSSQPGPYFETYMALSFFMAFVLSVVIEYAVVWLLLGWAKVVRPFRTVTLANLASYVVLVAVAWFWIAFVL
jgi:hypothetical protein